MSDTIARIIDLVAAYDGSAPRQRMYLLRIVDKPDDSLNQIGGCPPGITAESWPKYDGRPMEHLFTLDLDTMPGLRAPNSPTRAVAMFIGDRTNNQAWDPDNDETSLVKITDDDVAKCRLLEPQGEIAPIRNFMPVPVDVPTAVWNESSGFDEQMNELHNALYQASARVLGRPIWLQGETYYGNFLMQFDESFVDVNLGDMGVMYVFTETQFWQCH